ncbi:MAG: urease accessory protein UreF [Eubacterium sp.]|nr:urease accessory protein UreF [Eubacterium sp.]
MNSNASLLRRMEVFQICDSTFPIGTFNHSFGMENYLRDNRIRKAPDFKVWLSNYYRSQFRYGEGLLTILSWRAQEEGNPEKIAAYDDLLTRSTLALETRNGTKLIAKQMLILVKKIHGDSIPFLTDYEEAVKAGKAFGNPAAVFAIFAHASGMTEEETFLMYGYSVASTLVQNAVRSVPLGQREGQLILKDVIDLLGDLYEQTCVLEPDVLGANAPGLELAQICHETQEARLFMS